MDLSKKVAIVTGAGRGIGKAVSQALAEENCNVILSSNVENELEEVVSLISAIGKGSAFSYCLDLSSEDNILKLIKATIKKFNSIDILINNAGICPESKIVETTTEEWDKVMNINLRTPFILAREVLKIMKEKKDGYIINIASAIVSGGGPTADFAPYCASKYGLMGLSRSIYDESSKYGYNVKVSTIYPNMVKTSMSDSFKFSKDYPSYKWISPEDIAKTLIYLLKNCKTCMIEDLFIMSKRF